MVKKIRKKLNNQSGESISETLIALLIAAFALVMLAGAISAASNVVLASKDKVDKYYAENESMIKKETKGEGTVTIADITTGNKIDFNPESLDDSNMDLNVNYYTNGEFGSKTVIMYEVKTKE